MTPFFEPRPVPGAVATQGAEAGMSKSGKISMKPASLYVRTDRVAVATGSPQNLTGPTYTVQKVNGVWKIVHKSFWIR
jgi:hypothetical protein